MYKGTDYFATHFQNNITYTDPCLPAWNNDKFIDESFWIQNPTDQNIICAIYGSYNDTETAYTRQWENYDYSSCLSAGIGVNHVSSVGSTSQNNIYIVSSGSYSANGLQMEACSTIISSGTVNV